MPINDVFETLNNCWRALCRRMRDDPTSETQRVMNLLARIINTTESEVRKRQHAQHAEEKQISIEEWIAWLQEQ